LSLILGLIGHFGACHPDLVLPTNTCSVPWPYLAQQEQTICDYCKPLKQASDKELAAFMASRTLVPTTTTTGNPNHEPQTFDSIDKYFNSFFPAMDFDPHCSPTYPSPMNIYTNQTMHDFIQYHVPKICAPKHMPENWLHRDGPFETIFLTVVILFCIISLVHLMVSASTFSDMKPRLLPVVAVS
jgi:hypothetical protein